MPAPAAQLTWRTALVLFVIGLAYPLVQSTAPSSWSTREADGYYAALTEALFAGQLHLKIQPDPRLAQLADPYAGEQGIPRMHDAVYFQGRYYLYFGTTPVLLLYGPWHWLTGGHLSDGGGTVCFSLLAFALGAALLIRIRARHFAGLAEGWLIASLIAWGLGNQCLALSYSGAVYSVPITCAVSCLLGAALAAGRSLENPGRVRWTALASLAWGLAIAARPNYLASLGGALVLLGLQLRGNAQLPPAARTTAWRIAAAALLPLALIGAGLAAYNGARFGDIFEFGVRYMMMGGDPRQLAGLEAGRIPGALAALLGHAVAYGPYFPFAVPLDAGVVPTTPLVALAGLLPWLAWRGRAETLPWWRGLALALAGATAGNLATIAMLPTQHYRYVTDFLPALLVLGLTASWHILTGPGTGPGGRARTIRVAIALIFAVGLGHAIAIQAELLALTSRAPGLARLFDYPAHWLEQATGRNPGPLRLRGRVPAAAYGSVTPLVVTGRGRDIVYLRQVGPGDTRIGFFHAGNGGPESNPLQLEPGREAEFEIDLGSLYPPAEHPFFRGWPASAVEALRRRVRLRVDGTTVLEGDAAFAPGDLWDVQLGENREGLLTGVIAPGARWFSVERLPAPRADAPPLRRLAPVRMKVSFPPFVHFKREPLISTGGTGRGDLLYVIYTGPGELRLAHDSWNGGSIESGIIAYEPGREYSLEVDLGSLHPQPAGATVEGRLRVNWDGRVVFDNRRPFHASAAAELAFGYNAIGSSAAYAAFAGHIASITELDEFPAGETAYGAVRLTVRFPTDRPGAREPLVVTGRPGAGDFVYVVYAGPGTVRFGYDRWGFGGPLSDPVSVDYAADHEIEISLGSLYPSAEDAAAWADLPAEARARRRARLELRLDDRIVLSHDGPAFPAQPAEVAIGANPLGGSSCESTFTGRISSVRRMPLSGPR